MEIVGNVPAWYDGSRKGYSLQGTEIPLGARMIAIVEAFDAMTTDRPYRKGMPPWKALEEVVRNAGKQFDPEVVEAFKRVMGEKIEHV